MTDNQFHIISIDDLKKFLSELDNEKQDFQSPSDKIMWGMLNEISEKQESWKLNEWDMKFISNQLEQPQSRYSEKERIQIRRIHEKICPF